MGQAEVLFFFTGCFVRMTDGCHVRACQDLEMLVATDRSVAVYSYRNHGQWPWREADIENFHRRFPTVELVLDDWTFTLRIAQKVRSIAAIVGGRLGTWAQNIRIPGASPGLDKLRELASLRVAVVNYTWGSSHLNGRPAPRIIIDTHDLMSLERIQERPAGILDLAAYSRLRQELFYLGLADEIWSISYSEFWFLRAFLGVARIRMVPPALRSWELTRDISDQHPRFDLVFVGSDNRWNGKSVTALLRTCDAWGIGLKIGIAGAVCTNEEVRSVAEKIPGVELLGFVDDLDRLYASARAAVCPVEGTGTKIKLIEALKAGRPVFAAAGSMAGLLPGYETCVFPIDRNTVEHVLHDPRSLAAAQAAAISYSKVYDMEIVTEQVRSSIKHLA